MFSLEFTHIYRLGEVTQHSPGLWTTNADRLSYSTGLAAQVEDTLLEGVSLLHPLNLSNVGGIERILQMASDLSQRRTRESIARETNPSLRDRLGVNIWKEFTSRRLPSNESTDAGNETDSKNPDLLATSGKSSLVSQITNTVWKGITNQTAMESPSTPPSTPPSPTIPISIPQLEEDPKTTSSLWSYAEKLKGSDTIATLSKISSNWRARAFLDSSSSGGLQPTSIAGNENNHLVPTSSLFQMANPNLPLETALEGASTQSNRSLMDKTRSLLSPTRSPPPVTSKSAPRPLLLTSTLLTSGQKGLKSHRNLINSTESGEWTEVVREKQHHMYRDSLSSASSLSPSDAHVRTPKSTKSDREVDTNSSRIVNLNRRSVSPMAPNFRSAHGRLLSRDSSTSSEFHSPPIIPRSPLPESQTTHARVLTESPTLLQTYPAPSDLNANASKIITFNPKATDILEAASNESSVTGFTSSRPESEDAKLSIRSSRVRSKRYPRPTNLHFQDGQKPPTATEEKTLNSSQLTVEWPRDEAEIASTPKGSRFESEQYVSMPRKLSRSPLRSKKLSTGELERQRKTSMDTIRQRKVSNGHRARKISTESRETPKNKRDSSAEEGDDEGYDELLSAYESEDGPKSSSMF